MAGQGDYPLRSSWLGRGRGRGRGRGANPRKFVNVAARNGANATVWADWTFNAVGPSNQTLTPSVYTNTQTFYAATVTAIGGAQSLTPSLFTNGQTFFAPTVTSARNLAPSLVTNGQTFFAATVTATRNLTPSLFTNGQTLYSPAATNLNIIAPPMFADSEFVFPPIATLVGPPQTLTAPLFTNTIAFFPATIGDTPVQPILGSGSVVRPRRKFRPAILIDLPEEEKQLPDVSAKAILAGLSATAAVGSVVAISPDPINSRASISFTQIETYMRGVKAESTWNDPSDEEMLFILDFALD